MPSQLDLDEAQWAELLAYHRMKRAMENMCPECYEKTRDEKKICFWCGREYTERDWDTHAQERADTSRGSVVEGEQALALLMLAADKKDKRGEELAKAVWERWAEKLKREGKLK